MTIKAGDLIELLNSTYAKAQEFISEAALNKTKLGEIVATLLVNFDEKTGRTRKIPGCNSTQNPLNMLMTCLTYLHKNQRELPLSREANQELSKVDTV